jgi:hypothetical protein
MLLIWLACLCRGWVLTDSVNSWSNSTLASTAKMTASLRKLSYYTKPKHRKARGNGTPSSTSWSTSLNTILSPSTVTMIRYVWYPWNRFSKRRSFPLSKWTHSLKWLMCYLTIWRGESWMLS